jgi:hypothetical protein
VGVVDVRFAADAIAYILENFDDAPTMLHLLSPTLPSKRDLLSVLRKANPGLRVVWLPPPVLHVLSWTAVALQKVLRPGRPAMSLSRIFATKRLDSSRIASLNQQILEHPSTTSRSPAPTAPLANPTSQP